MAYAEAAYGDPERGPAARGFNVEIVKRSDYTEVNRLDAEGKGKAFVPLPEKWVIERTFLWLTWSRRLCTSYDRLTQVVEARVLLGSLRHTLLNM